MVNTVQPPSLQAFDILVACRQCGQELFEYRSNQVRSLPAMSSNFGLHMSDCSGSLGIPCSKCGVHQSSDELANYELTCNGKFTSRDGREWYLQETSAVTIHPSAVRYMKHHEPKQFVCGWKDDHGPPCAHTYRKKGKLNQHITYIHKEKGLCHLCPVYVCLSSSETLKKHLKIKHSVGPARQNKACTWQGCGKMMSHRAMKRHMLQHTKLEYRAPCRGCFYPGGKIVVHGEVKNSQEEDAIVETYLSQQVDPEGVSLLDEGHSRRDEASGLTEWNQHMIRELILRHTTKSHLVN